MDRWSAHVIGGKRTQFLGSVTAPDEHKALAEAIKVFKVPTDWQTRIIVSAKHWMVQVKIEGPLMPRYRVDIRGKELQQLGTVDAPNAWEALAKAVDLFDIRPALRSKTVVTKIEEPDDGRPQNT